MLSINYRNFLMEQSTLSIKALLNCVMHGRQNRENYGDLTPTKLRVAHQEFSFSQWKCVLLDYLCPTHILLSIPKCNLKSKSLVKWPIEFGVKRFVGFVLESTLRSMETTDYTYTTVTLQRQKLKEVMFIMVCTLRKSWHTRH